MYNSFPQNTIILSSWYSNPNISHLTKLLTSHTEVLETVNDEISYNSIVSQHTDFLLNCWKLTHCSKLWAHLVKIKSTYIVKHEANQINSNFKEIKLMKLQIISGYISGLCCHKAWKYFHFFQKVVSWVQHNYSHWKENVQRNFTVDTNGYFLFKSVNSASFMNQHKGMFNLTPVIELQMTSFIFPKRVDGEIF